MTAINSLILSCLLFIGTHLAMSHPLRAPLVARLGERAFQLLYSVVSIATFLMIVRDFRAVPPETPWWVAGDAMWATATAIMLLGSILFVGSLIGNPALPAPGADKAAAAPVRGVFAITRHPMMWGFALWALVHVMVMPTMANVILCAAMAFMALVGSAGQDVKKARLMGDAWRSWTARTSFIPFAGLLSGSVPWSAARLRPHDLFGGLVVWLAATWAHGGLGYMTAGIWRWL